VRPVTALFLDSLQSTHTFAARLQIVSQTTPYAVGATFPLIGGSVTLDRNADMYATLNDATIIAPWPIGNNTPASRVDGSATEIDVDGVQVRVQRGIRYANQQTEYVTLGVFVVTSITQDGLRTTPVLKISGEDRSTLIRSAGRPTPTQWLYDESSHHDLISSILNMGHASLTYVADYDTSAMLADDLILEEGNDPWSFLQETMRGIGKLAWFDADGMCQITDVIPNNMTVPSWTVKTGHNGAKIKSSRTLTRSNQYNAVLVTGERSSEIPPSLGFAYDAATYGDAYGRRLKTIQSNLITTDDEAKNVAQAELALCLGVPSELTIDTVPNPAIEPLDIIEVIHEDGVIETHIVDSAIIPLDVTTAVTLATRETSSTLTTEASPVVNWPAHAPSVNAWL